MQNTAATEPAGLSTTPEPQGSEYPFSPREYLEHNHSGAEAVCPENGALYAWLLRMHAKHSPRSFLEFGGGPALYSPLCAVAASPSVSVHFADYFRSNLDEVAAWLARDPAAFDWTPTADFITSLLPPGSGHITSGSQLCQLLQAKLEGLMRCDAKSPTPLLLATGASEAQYDVVAANYLFNAVAKSYPDLCAAVANVGSLVRPGGVLLISSSLERSVWHVQDSEDRLVGSLSLMPVKLTELMGAIRAAGFDTASEPVFTDSSEYGGTRYVYLECVKRA